MEKAKEARRRVEKVSITCGFLGSWLLWDFVIHEVVIPL
jgi:hypothetical protein